mgnify:CR=1 FL=1|jgi:uncharacterized protein (DUF885 family)
MNKEIKDFFKKYFDDYIVEHPLMATFIGNHKYNHLYPNYLLDSEIEKSKKFNLTYLDKTKNLKKKFGKTISKQEIHFLNLLQSRLEDNLEGYKHNFHLLPLDHFDNFIIDYIDLVSGKSYFPLKTKKDFQNLISKTKHFLVLCDTAICRMREGMDKKITWSKEIMKRCCNQFKDVIKSKSYLVEDSKIPSALKKEYNEVMDKRFTKMINKFIKFLEEEYIPNCHTHMGLKKIPGGPDMYKYLVKSYTTLKNPSIEDIHQKGLKEVSRIEKGIKKLFEGTNLKKPEPKSFKDFLFKTKKAVIDDYEEVRKIVNNELLPKYFDITISHDYLLKKVPKFKEEHDAGAYYMMCSIDNKRKGTFFLNMANLEDHQTFSTMSLSLHEGNPGHHFQLTYANDVKLPDFVTYCGDETSYVEGWALYCESLTHDFLKESGKKKDIMYRYGCYNYEMMRACRLVVDTGIHYYGWNFKKCFDFMRKYTSFSDNEIEVEIYRYSTYAAQALSYKIGEMKFQELRKYFLKNKKGSLKDFHKLVLENGACSLDLLEKLVINY